MKGTATINIEASCDSHPIAYNAGTTARNGIMYTSNPISLLLSPIISPQFLNVVASSSEIVSWVLYRERKIANPIATSAAAIAIAIEVNTHPLTSP